MTLFFMFHKCSTVVPQSAFGRKLWNIFFLNGVLTRSLIFARKSPSSLVFHSVGLGDTGGRARWFGWQWVPSRAGQLRGGLSGSYSSPSKISRLILKQRVLTLPSRFLTVASGVRLPFSIVSAGVKKPSAIKSSTSL